MLWHGMKSFEGFLRWQSGEFSAGSSASRLETPLRFRFGKLLTDQSRFQPLGEPSF